MPVILTFIQLIANPIQVTEMLGAHPCPLTSDGLIPPIAPHSASSVKLRWASLAICLQLRKWDRSTSNSSWSNGSIPDSHNANSLFLLILPNPVILFMTSYFLNTKVVLVNSENSDSIKKNPREVKISNLPPNEK